MKFGDVYFLPPCKARKGIDGHHVVILFADSATKEVYFQTMESGIFKIFPNFGILNGNGCANCMQHFKARDFKRYLSNKSLYLDIDDVIFLNFNKYKFLTKETFVCLQKIEKDNYFLFNQKVNNKVYKYKGSLLDINKKQALVATLYSGHISKADKKSILHFS